MLTGWRRRKGFRKWANSLGATAALACACAPADPGFGVRVSNGCAGPAELVLDGGEPPGVFPDRAIQHLGPGESVAYSVMAGDDVGGFVWVRSPGGEPPGRPVVFSHPLEDEVAAVDLRGSPCEPVFAGFVEDAPPPGAEGG